MLGPVWKTLKRAISSRLLTTCPTKENIKFTLTTPRLCSSVKSLCASLHTAMYVRVRASVEWGQAPVFADLGFAAPISLILRVRWWWQLRLAVPHRCAGTCRAQSVSAPSAPNRSRLTGPPSNEFVRRGGAPLPVWLGRNAHIVPAQVCTIRKGVPQSRGTSFACGRLSTTGLRARSVRSQKEKPAVRQTAKTPDSFSRAPGLT